MRAAGKPFACGRLLPVAACALIASGCASRVKGPAGGLPGLREGRVVSEVVPNAGGADGSIDVAQEEAVSDGCLSAWRTALSGGADSAIKQLKALERRYPKQTAVSLMMGQIMERSGRKKEAVKLYSEVVERSNGNPVYRIKYAGLLATAGNTTAAIAEYRKLLVSYPGFVQAKLGLARLLWAGGGDKPEARLLVKQALDLEPDNREAISFMKEIAGAR